MNKRLVCLLYVVCCFPVIVISQINKETTASIEGLGKVIVYPDHTWKMADPSLDSNYADLQTSEFCDTILLAKYVNNKGEGDDLLMGARNLRTILKGIAYRGGANNLWSCTSNRDNNNPLPLHSLLSLRKAGFTDVVYLYNKNFNFYYPDSILGKLDELGVHYQSIPPHEDSIAYKILKLIHYKIKNPGSGPVYLHCWNGWHMSGLISAYSLMQFCNFKNQRALDYWRKGTDGVDKGYEKIKSRISHFKPYPELEISPEEKLKICPCIQ